MTDHHRQDWNEDEFLNRVANSGGNGSWYWSPRQSCHALITDGVTTTRDLGAQIAAGGGNPLAEADYWVMAATLATTSAHRRLKQAQNAHTPTSPPAAVTAAVAAAQDYHHTTATHQHLAQVARTAHTDRAYRDTEHHLAHDPGGDALRAVLDTAWRDAARIGYTELVIDYGNDGPRDSDRALPAADHGRRATLIDFIEHHTGVPSPHIRHQIGEAVYAYSRAPGTDDDPDYFAPPAWDSFFTQWQAEQAERQEILDDAKGAARWDPGPAEHDPHFLTWTTLAEAAEAAAQAQHAADAAAGKSADDILTEILTGLDTGTDLRDGPLTAQDDDGDDDGGGWGDEPAAGEIRLGGRTSLAGRDYTITDGTTTPTTATTAHDDPPPREQKQITASPGDTPVTEGATPTPPPGQLRPASQRPPRAAAAVAAAHNALTSLHPREGTGRHGPLTHGATGGHPPAQHTRDQADDTGQLPLLSPASPSSRAPTHPPAGRVAAPPPGGTS